MNVLTVIEQARKQRENARLDKLQQKCKLSISYLKECRVRQGFISVDGVSYTAPVLEQFNSKTVKVEHIVNVYDENGNLIASKHNLGSANTLTSM